MNAIYLGQRLAKGQLAPNGYGYEGDAHILTIGPTRSGKSRRLLIPNLAYDTGRSMVVVDIKAELAAITAAHRARFGEVLVLNPFGLLADDPRYALKSAGYNPLLSLDPAADAFADDAMALAEALVTVAPDSGEPHWAESAQDVVAGLVMLVRQFAGTDAGVFVPDEDWGRVKTATLGEMRRLLTLPPPRFAALALKALKLSDQVPALANKLGAFFVLSDGKEHRELDSILSTARTQTRFLDSAPVVAARNRNVADAQSRAASDAN